MASDTWNVLTPLVVLQITTIFPILPKALRVNLCQKIDLKLECIYFSIPMRFGDVKDQVIEMAGLAFWLWNLLQVII